jgi:hypothetical protein
MYKVLFYFQHLSDEVAMGLPTIALFGEAEKGEFCSAYFCSSLPQLADCLGNPPDHSRAIDYAVQALYYHYNLIFFRVREEGFSEPDYYRGATILKDVNQPALSLVAICIPGVGSHPIIQVMFDLCTKHHSILITTESDLYDYITHR